MVWQTGTWCRLSIPPYPTLSPGHLPIIRNGTRAFDYSVGRIKLSALLAGVSRHKSRDFRGPRRVVFCGIEDADGSNLLCARVGRSLAESCLHRVFGASKGVADILVQEYGRYFGLRTGCFRGGCLTGPSHSGTQLHGFLAYLIRCNMTNTRYSVFGVGSLQ